MQKLLMFALAGVAATLVLGGSFASGATSSDDDHMQRIVAVLSLTSFHFVDVGPKGVSPGDETTFTKTFKNTSGSVVGFGHGSCVVVTVSQKGDPPAPNARARHDLATARSNPRVFDHLTSPQTFPIVGGTGRFRDAGGQIIAGGGPGEADIYEIEF